MDCVSKSVASRSGKVILQQAYVVLVRWHWKCCVQCDSLSEKREKLVQWSESSAGPPRCFGSTWCRRDWEDWLFSALRREDTWKFLLADSNTQQEVTEEIESTACQRCAVTTKDNSLPFDKVTVKIFSIWCIAYCSCCPFYYEGNANTESFPTFLKYLSSIRF